MTQSLKNSKYIFAVLVLVSVALAACGGNPAHTSYRDVNMDFAALRTVAVMPFQNLTDDKLAAERVRDTFMTALLSTGALYVIPPGEVARGIARANVLNPTAPSVEELGKMVGLVKADAVITGVVKEFGVLKSGTASAGVVSMSVQMIEAQTQRVVWAAATTQGGISTWDRLLGGGGQPMNNVIQAAINDLISKLFQ